MEPEIEQIENFTKDRKTELCRFYLRGVCVKKSNECYLSHGIWDLHYRPYIEGEDIIYDYSKLKKDEHFEKTYKGPRVYTILYQYQKEKVFTLQQINQDGAKRRLVRNQMHQEMFNDFMDLLQCYYPEANFTQSFLVKQFTRVGFNKITMSSIKLSNISAYVCDPPSSRFYVVPVKMPPLVNRQVNYIIPLATEEETEQFYKQQYEEYLKNCAQEANETQIKKFMFAVTRPSLSIMPLNMFLKRKKMNFTNFLKCISDKGHQLINEVDQETLLKSASNFVDQKVKKQAYCSWIDVYKFLGTEHKVNNANVTNPLKPRLIQYGYYFLNFPMIQIISSEEKIFNWTQCQRTCTCQMNKMYSQEQLMIEFLTLQQAEAFFPIKQSFDIFNIDTLRKCAPVILQSKMIGVDLQGRLRKGGYVQMIQINTGRNTFLVDIFRMLQENDIEAYELTKKIMRNIMCDKNILKIFHDCRHDSLALHEVINTCIINIFDTSAVQTFRGQLQIYKKHSENPKAVLKQITNIKTPGLNQILKTYHAPHGINKNKVWFHELWKKGKTELFEMRPLDPEYRDYCIMDVLDLLHVHKQMSEALCPNFTSWLSSNYVRQGFLYTLQEK